MSLTGRRHASTIYVDGERFNNVDIMALHKKYGYAFNLWIYADRMQKRSDFDDAILVGMFLIFDEAKQEVIEQWQREKFQS